MMHCNTCRHSMKEGARHWMCPGCGLTTAALASRLGTSAQPIHAPALLESLSPAQREEADRLALPPVLSNRFGLILVLIPPGRFLMGSENGDPHEKPVHEVVLTRPFYLSLFPVTQGQWSLMQGPLCNTSFFKGDDRRPVEQVSFEGSKWRHAIQGLDRLNFAERLRPSSSCGYRLPTEAEWELACRAGSSTEFHWGDEFDPSYCWYAGNSRGTTQPVGARKPNAFGLHDITGNVQEYCMDWYSPDTYKTRGPRAEDPRGPESGIYHVVRGGAWNKLPHRMRSAHRVRAYEQKNYWNDFFGIRPALSIPP